MPLPLPSPGGDRALLPHQVEAVVFALERSAAYLALKPGLGKTPIAAIVSAALHQAHGFRVVYVTPPFLVKNVAREFKAWAPSLRVAYLRDKDAASAQVLIVPDSLLHADGTSGLIEWCFVGQSPALVIVDEAHRFKNLDAKRTRELLGFRSAPGVVDFGERTLYLSGTPMPNGRPMELYPVLAKSAPETIGGMSQWQFGRQYCAGRYTPWGWDFSGASNVKELARRIKAPTGSFMLSMSKKLLNLPPKIEEVFTLSSSPSSSLRRLDRSISESLSVEEILKNRIAAKIGKTGEELHLATYRRLLGLEKIKPGAEYVRSILDETNEAVLLLAFHKEVIAELATKLADYRPYVVTGDTPPSKRQGIVDEFQRSKARNLFIANYVAIGVGLTMTRATRVIELEYDWNPGVSDQATDRTHRIGQNRRVLVQRLVFENSLDQKIVEAVMRKRRVMEHI